MAKLTIQGLDGVIADMKRLGELEGETADKMLTEGAKIVEEEWKSAIKKADLVDTGAMLKSVKATKPKTSKDVRTIEVFPQGKDKKGVRNAEKAFVNHYGTSSIKATRFVDEANEKAEPRVLETYERIWNDHMIERG